MNRLKMKLKAVCSTDITIVAITRSKTDDEISEIFSSKRAIHFFRQMFPIKIDDIYLQMNSSRTLN